MNLKPLIPIALLIGLVACVKEAQMRDKTITFVYAQTQCADKWGYGNNDAQTAQKLRHYLDSAGMTGPLFDITVKDEHVPATCLACTCPSGKTFLVSVMDAEGLKQKYLELGFSLKP